MTPSENTPKKHDPIFLIITPASVKIKPTSQHTIPISKQGIAINTDIVRLRQINEPTPHFIVDLIVPEY